MLERQVVTKNRNTSVDKRVKLPNTSTFLAARNGIGGKFSVRTLTMHPEYSILIFLDKT